MSRAPVDSLEKRPYDAGHADVKGGLWRIDRPLREGAAASWMRLFYDLLYDLAFSAHTLDDAAKITIAHAHATFRSEYVAVALLDDHAWNVLPYRQNETTVEPLRIEAAGMKGYPEYEAGQVVEVPDFELFAERFPAFRPAVDRNVRSLVAAAFGSRVHGGYLIFASHALQHFSDDEFRLMALYALAAGIGLERAGTQAA